MNPSINAEIQSLVEGLHASSTMAVIATAGAGTQAISWLFGVAGASRTVLELLVPYSPSSFVEFVGHEPEQFVAAQAARDMARSAYRRALHLREGSTPVVGVACTATIATDRPKRGEHRCHVALWNEAGVSTFSLEFVKGLRDRAGEDGIASMLVLRALSEASGVEFGLDLGLDARERIEIDSVRYEDSVKGLIASHVSSVTIHPDGSMAADVPVRGGVLSGSFNPLHEGHERLASAASEMLGEDVAFELSITNVDKPPLEEAEIRRRVAQFAGKHRVVVTRALVFYQKAVLFPVCAFVIGWDTVTRLVDPRYYDGKLSRMMAALEDIRRQDCRFLVAGRVDDGTFHTLDEVAIPNGLEDLFMSIPESAFRSDLSSTALRLTSQRP